MTSTIITVLRCEDLVEKPLKTSSYLVTELRCELFTGVIVPGVSYKFCFSVVLQFYQTRVNDEFVLKGNTGTLKCLIPSFVADFVHVLEWISDAGPIYSSQMSKDVVNYGNDIHIYLFEKSPKCPYFDLYFCIWIVLNTFQWYFLRYTFTTPSLFQW